MDTGYIFLDHLAFLDQPGEMGGSFLGPGIDHDTANIFVQSVEGIEIASQQFLQPGRYFLFGIQPYRFEANSNFFIGIKNFHPITPLSLHYSRWKPGIATFLKWCIIDEREER